MTSTLNDAADPAQGARRLLLVLPRTSYRGEAYVRAAHRLGVELTLGSDGTSALSRHGRPVLELDLARPDAAAETVLAGGQRFDGVLGTDEPSTLVAAHVAQALGLPASAPDAAWCTRDKRRMRERLGGAGVPQPRARVLEPHQGAAALADTDFPCVVKPPMLSGSQGVIRADDEAGLAAAIARVRSILARHPSSWREHPDFHRLLVEDYIDGPEVAVEALMQNGQLEPIAVFDKPDDLVGPFFEETIYVTPSRHSPGVEQQILEVTERAACALGLLHGPIHAELRIARTGPQIVELAGRSIGGLCSRTLELCAENLEERLVAHAVGLPARSLGVGGAAAAGVMMIPIPRAGVFRHARGVERARAVEGVEDIVITARPGDALYALPEGSSYLGFIFARGDAPGAVEAALRAAHAELELQLSPLLSLL